MIRKMRTNAIVAGFTMDELAIMPDFELERHAGRLNALRYDDMHHHGGNRTAIEIDIAYAQREMQIRQLRWDEHVKYTKDRLHLSIEG